MGITVKTVLAIMFQHPHQSLDKALSDRNGVFKGQDLYGVIDLLKSVFVKDQLYIVTIFLGLSVGSKLGADQFLDWSTLGILALGMVAFAIGTASGVLMGKLLT